MGHSVKQILSLYESLILVEIRAQETGIFVWLDFCRRVGELRGVLLDFPLIRHQQTISDAPSGATSV